MTAAPVEFSIVPRDETPATVESRLLYSDDMEQAVLSAMLQDSEAVRKAADFIDDDSMFYREKNRRIFRAILALAERGSAVDPLILSDELLRRGDLESSGGKEYIGLIWDAVPTASNVEYHAKEVRKKALQRRAVAKATQFINEIQSPDGDAEAALREIQTLSLEAGEKPRYVFLDEDQLEELPDASWIIEGLLPDRGLFEIHGRRGSGKGFFVLDVLLSIQTGTPFHDRPVKKGNIVYVSVEGAGGLKKRRKAWSNFHGHLGHTGALFMRTAVPLINPGEVARFLRDLQARAGKNKIAVVVFDTLAKCMIGGDENSTRDMGLFVDGAERIQRELDCVVGIVHHVGRNGDEERGNSALGGGMDAMFKVSKDGPAVTVKCTKMKDEDDDITLDFRLEPEPGAGSMILTSKTGWKLSDPTPSPAERTLLELLPRSFPDEYPSTSKWLAVSELSPSTFHRLRGDLVARGYVIGRKEGKSVFNVLTPKGLDLFGLNSQITSTSLSESNAAITTPTAPPLGKGAGKKSGGIREPEFLTRQEEDDFFASQTQVAG